MEEGTFPPNPGLGVPSQQDSRETPLSSNQAQQEPEMQPAVTPEQVRHHQVQPIVYKTNNQLPQDDGGNKPRGFPFKKIILISLAIVLAISVLAAVIVMLTSNKDTEITEDVTLTYWGVHEDEAVIKPIIDEFEKENPNIKVDYIKQDIEDYRERLSARSENNKGPDIFRFHTSWYPMISNILLPLPEEVIKKGDFNSRYYGFMQNDLVKNGTIYGIPLYTDTLSLYVNSDLLNNASSGSEKPVSIPKTWQEFIDTSIALTKIDDNGAIIVGGAGIGTYNNVKYAPDIISLIMAQNGVDLNNPEDYSEKIADAIRFYTNFSRVENNVWDSTQENSINAFTQGKLAMFFGYSWDYFEIKSQNPNLQINIVPVPQLISDDPINIASYWAEGISTTSQNPQEAFLFLKYLARGDTQERLYEEASKSREFGEPYSIISLADKLKDTKAQVFVEQSNSAISSPFVFVVGTGLNDRNTKLNVLLNTTVDNILNRSSLDTEIEGFINGYKQIVNEVLAN